MQLLKNNSYFDYQRRLKFNKIEGDYLIKKTLILNQNVPLIIRTFFFFQKQLKKTRIKNYCKITGKSRTVFKDLGLSRMPFKHFISQRLLSGFKRVSQ
jgi:ribosomal protein S14